jgi:hypothetical protein
VLQDKKIGTRSPQRELYRKQIKSPIRVFFGYDEKEDIEACRKRGEPFLYADHAYFDRGYERGNFRVLYNTIHQTKELDYPDDRRKKFGVKLRDWHQGKNILFIPAPPNPLWFHKHPKWNEDAIDILVRNTQREIIVKHNKTKGLGDAVKNLWAIVTHSSVAGVEAACAGVPVICPDTCPAWPIGRNLEYIESPVMPDRDKWVNTLTYSQFSLDELKSGSAWAIIKEMNGL